MASVISRDAVLKMAAASVAAAGAEPQEMSERKPARAAKQGQRQGTCLNSGDRPRAENEREKEREKRLSHWD
ncbi:Hypothetical predicted protein [Pelobates cultripes]|uniref:Uncharacterized protein n=1 Tax=Pelobates cultripes TaxID=61616 RepID=A0AAD1SJR1_PELCU|nr:Hypothetical predicted protein [Pelobates cultripes]